MTVIIAKFLAIKLHDSQSANWLTENARQNIDGQEKHHT